MWSGLMDALEETLWRQVLLTCMWISALGGLVSFGYLVWQGAFWHGVWAFLTCLFIAAALQDQAYRRPR